MKNYIIIALISLPIFTLAFWQTGKKEKIEKVKTTDTIFITDTIIVTDTIEVTKIVEDTAVFITPTKMDILYIGIDNPMDVSVFGEAENIGVTISNGEIEKKGNGKYVVRVKKVEETTVRVYSEGSLIAARKFRCRVVPDPIATVGGKRGGNISKDTLLAQNYVMAGLDNFPYDIKFPVTEFTQQGKSCWGNDRFLGSEITKQKKAELKQYRSGDIVPFEDIKARAPDGSIRLLNSIVFTVE